MSRLPRDLSLLLSSIEAEIVSNQKTPIADLREDQRRIRDGGSRGYY